jgi:hypothetical protein
MVLRSPFATYAIQRYRNGELFSDLSEELFFDCLGAMMNTSSQMFRDVYGGCDPDDYRATATEMMKIYGRDLDDEFTRQEYETRENRSVEIEIGSPEHSDAHEREMQHHSIFSTLSAEQSPNIPWSRSERGPEAAGAQAASTSVLGRRFRNLFGSDEHEVES